MTQNAARKLHLIFLEKRRISFKISIIVEPKNKHGKHNEKTPDLANIIYMKLAACAPCLFLL